MKRVIFVFTSMILFFAVNSINAQSHYDTYVNRVNASTNSYANHHNSRTYNDRYGSYTTTRRNSSNRNCGTPPPPPRRTCGNSGGGYHTKDKYRKNRRNCNDATYVVHRYNCPSRNSRVRDCSCRYDDRYRRDDSCDNANRRRDRRRDSCDRNDRRRDTRRSDCYTTRRGTNYRNTRNTYNKYSRNGSYYTNVNNNRNCDRNRSQTYYRY